MIWRAQNGAGSGPEPAPGTDTESKQLIELTAGGKAVQVGVRASYPEYVELFAALARGTTGDYSPPFHGGGEQDGYPGEYAYDWDDATFGGADILQLAIEELRADFPPWISLPGGEQNWVHWEVAGTGLHVGISLMGIERDDPDFDEFAYADGSFDYFKPSVLDDLSFFGRIWVQLGPEPRMQLFRTGTGFGTQEFSGFRRAGITGFSWAGALPRIWLAILDGEHLVLASDGKTMPDYSTLANGWPYVSQVPSFGWPSLDDWGVHENPDFGKGGKRLQYWTAKGWGRCYG